MKRRYLKLRGLEATLTIVVLWGGLSACTDRPADPQPVETAENLSEVTLQRVDPPSGSGAMAPNLSRGRDGVSLTWIEPVDVAARLAGKASDNRLLLSRWDGEDWSAPVEVASGDGFFANWADIPAVVETAEGTLLAHWLEKLGADTYAYGVQLTRSQDGGAMWDRLGLLHDDASEVEHGFVSFVSGSDGVQAFWLDGRAMDGNAEGAMQLRTAKIGTDWNEPGQSTLLDDRVCECCQTDAALTSRGPIVVYRDRSATEIRDISVIRATEDGWSPAVTLADDGWQIHGCPVNGPAVAAAGERVAVAWFTAAEEKPRVSLAFSDDAGLSFGSTFTVDAEQALGRVDVALDPSGGAWVTWLAMVAEERGELRLQRFTAAGEVGAPQVVAETTTHRSAGVARMVEADGRLMIVWVEDAKPSRLKVAVRSIS